MECATQTLQTFMNEEQQMRKFLLASVFALASPALADTITATAIVDGGAPVTTSSATGTLNINNVALGVFSLNTVSIDSQSILPAPGIINTNTLNLQQTATGSHTLALDIVASGLTGPGTLASLLSSFSVSGLTAGWTARERTFINGVQLSDTGIFTASSDSAFSINPAVLTNPFSAEVRYDIVSNGIGGFNGGIDISRTGLTQEIPGPIVGAGMPGLVMACFGLIGLGWRRARRRIGLVA
jgi:hypothetical protein